MAVAPPDRTHLWPGVAVGAGGAVLLVSAFVPWAALALQDGGILGGLVTVDLGASVQRGLDGGLRVGMVLSALALVAFGTAFALVPRLRGLWRVGTVLALVVPVLAGVWAWRIVSGDGALPPTLLGGEADEVLRAVLESAPDLRSMFAFRPAAGMWLASVGLVLAVLGLLLPGRAPAPAEADVPADPPHDEARWVER